MVLAVGHELKLKLGIKFLLKQLKGHSQHSKITSQAAIYYNQKNYGRQPKLMSYQIKRIIN